MTKEKHPPEIIGFMNAYTSGKSGGDVCFAEILKRWPQATLTVITSQAGTTFLRQQGLDAPTLETSRESTIQRLILTYIVRTWRACLLLLKVGAQGKLLYASSDFFPDTLPCFFARVLLGRRHTLWIQKVHHLIPRSRPLPHFTQRMSLFLIRNFADLIFVVNPDLREHLLSQGCRPEKIHLSTNGVDLAWLSQLPARVDRRYAGVFLGRLHQSKGIFDLVDIWSTVRNHLPEARLAVIGGGPASLRDELARAVADAGLQSSIDILGYLDATEAFGIVKAADLFVFPSHEEGFGIAPLEAMGCGTPVVAYDLPAYRHVFGSTIETVPCFDYGRLGDRCVALLQDGAHRETRVQAGLAFAQDFDWQAIAQKEWDLLNSMERS